MEATLVRVRQDFSIQGCDWSFKIRKCLQAHHTFMWEVIENDFTPTYNTKAAAMKVLLHARPIMQRTTKILETTQPKKEKKLTLTTFCKGTHF